eukprot:825627-Prymnesium_polylepis.1
MCHASQSADRPGKSQWGSAGPRLPGTRSSEPQNGGCRRRRHKATVRAIPSESRRAHSLSSAASCRPCNQERTPARFRTQAFLQAHRRGARHYPRGAEGCRTRAAALPQPCCGRHPGSDVSEVLVEGPERTPRACSRMRASGQGSRGCRSRARQGTCHFGIESKVQRAERSAECCQCGRIRSISHGTPATVTGAALREEPFSTMLIDKWGAVYDLHPSAVGRQLARLWRALEHDELRYVRPPFLPRCDKLAQPPALVPLVRARKRKVARGLHH